MTGDTHLHCVVQQLVLELLDVEDLLEEVVELLLVHELVPQHGGGQPLARPPRLLVLGYCVLRVVLHRFHNRLYNHGEGPY